MTELKKLRLAKFVILITCFLANYDSEEWVFHKILIASKLNRTFEVGRNESAIKFLICSKMVKNVNSCMSAVNFVTRLRYFADSVVGGVKRISVF